MSVFYPDIPIPEGLRGLLMPSEPTPEVHDGEHCGAIDPLSEAVCTRAAHRDYGHTDASDPLTTISWSSHHPTLIVP